MSRIAKLLAKPQQLELNGEVLDIYPLTVEHLDIIFDMDKEDKRAEAMGKLIKLTLKKAVPDTSEDEMNNVSMEFLEPLINCIVEVNGLSDDKASAIKERLAQQRALKRESTTN